MKKALLLFLLGAVFVGASAGFASDKVYNLKLATVVTPPHPWTIAGEAFAKRIEEATDGKVKVSFHHSSSLGNDQNMIDGMRMGVIDLAIAGTTPLAAFAPEFAVFSIPFLFQSDEVFDRAMAHDSPLFEYFVQKVQERKLGISILSLCGGGVRTVSNNLRPIVTPDDMKGMKMRVTANPITSKIWAAAGALPSPMAWGEIYSAMQTGVVNCFDSTISGYYGSKYFEVAPHLAKTNHEYMVSYVAVSDMTLKKLPAEYRDAIVAIADEIGLIVTSTGRQFDEEKLVDMVANHGVKVSEVDMAAWIDLYRPLQDEMAEGLSGTKDGAKILGLIRSIQ